MPGGIWAILAGDGRTCCRIFSRCYSTVGLGTLIETLIHLSSSPSLRTTRCIAIHHSVQYRHKANTENKDRSGLGFHVISINRPVTFSMVFKSLVPPLNADLNSGYATGAGFVSGSILELNQSRADARTAYLDPVTSRPNLELLTGYTVTHILNGVVGNHTSQELARRPGIKSGKVTVTGVEIAVNSTTPRYNISCKKEIILTAGVILSPVLLQISGFGPAEHLKNNLNVDVLVNLPGVGSNLQDHAMIQPVYNCERTIPVNTVPYINELLEMAPEVFSVSDIDSDIKDAIREEYLANRTGALVNNQHRAMTTPSPRDLPPSYDDTLRAGYEAQETEVRALLSRRDVAAYEFMAASWGQLAVSAMHTLSRGTIHAGSSSIFGNEPPVIDLRICSHTFDCEILRTGVEFNDRFIATEAMGRLLPVLPTGLKTRDIENRTALIETIRAMARTEFHPSGTAAMMPRSAGGVADTNLRVYGTTNLRMVDASIMPLIPSGHIQAAIYAIAEKAADIIRLENWTNHPPPPFRPPSSPSSRWGDAGRLLSRKPPVVMSGLRNSRFCNVITKIFLTE
ncbi:hypothetical protein RRF57_000642 [Xylaria bambusicola]|uniref:Glucose-methanol-choline oxidoreductase N-terminal domain-containing protein n=1 Tax=Xylaria bambusicola TaxID=326684 RepID=A0AAN7UEE7_9PEZI